MPTTSNTPSDPDPSKNRMGTVFPMDTTTDIDLTDDEKRLVHAQQLLNNVRGIHNELDRDDPDEDVLRSAQNTLSETGILLKLAEYEDTTEIQNAIARIERYLTSKHSGATEDDLFAKRELAIRAIDSAARTDPMHNL